MNRRLMLVVPTAAVALLAAAAMHARTAPIAAAPKLAKEEVAAPASLGVVRMVGQKSGIILDNAAILGFEVQYTSPFQTGSTGPQFGTLTFTKNITRGSVLLFSSASQNENITQTKFVFTKTTGNGAATDYYQVELVNASIVNVHQFINTVQKDGTTDKLVTESVTLGFEKIIFTSLPDATSVGIDNLRPGT